MNLSTGGNSFIQPRGVIRKVICQNSLFDVSVISPIPQCIRFQYLTPSRQTVLRLLIIVFYCSNLACEFCVASLCFVSSLAEEEKAGCFTLVVLWLSLFVSFPIFSVFFFLSLAF